MEGTLLTHCFSIRAHSFQGNQILSFFRQNQSYRQVKLYRASNAFIFAKLELSPPSGRKNCDVKVSAVRRRRADLQSDTYVLMEPGKSEEFVSEEVLRIRLKGWLENWPGNDLPPDLARFKTIDDAVSHLLKSACELEIDGEVGSVQWYQVQLE